LPTKEDILEALKNVYDPEIGVSVVDLGLIYNVEVKDDKAEILMTLTSPFCPLMRILPKIVEDEVRKLGFKEVSVELTFDPPWTPERMSEEAKRLLQYRATGTPPTEESP